MMEGNNPIDEILKEQKKLQEQQDKLNRQIEILEEENNKKEARNKTLQKNIDELLEQIKKAEEQVDRAKKESSLNEIKIEPMFYLKGMFQKFDFHSSTLCILIGGNEYFYPIEDYHCAYLPVSGSRVLVFKSEEGQNMVYAFDVSTMIPPAKKIKAEVKAVLPVKNIVKFHTKEYGYLSVEAGEHFFENISIKIGDHVVLNQVSVDGDYYFSINEANQGKSMRDAVLKTFLKENS